VPAGVANVFDRRTLEFGTNFTLVLGDGEEFDLLAEMAAIGGYEAIIGRAVDMELAGQSIKVLALEDLIRTKRAAGRPKDLAVLPMLEATLQMRRQHDST
jgi:predicted nucleotidyltransferase